MIKPVGSVGGATKSPNTSTRRRSLSRGAVFQKMAAQKMAASSSPSQRYVDLRGDLPNCSSITADENDDKRNFIRHLRIVAAAINADDTASAADREVSRRYQSYAASLDAELYKSLGVVAAQVVKISDLAGMISDHARKTIDKRNPELGILREVNSNLKAFTQERFNNTKRERAEYLKAKKRQYAPKISRNATRREGALGRHINFELT